MHGIAVISLYVARQQNINGYCGESLVINFTIVISSRLTAYLLAVNHVTHMGWNYVWHWREISNILTGSDNSVISECSVKVLILDENHLFNTMKSRGPISDPWKFCVLLFCSLRKTFWTSLDDFIYSFLFCGTETESIVPVPWKP